VTIEANIYIRHEASSDGKDWTTTYSEFFPKSGTKFGR